MHSRHFVFRPALSFFPVASRGEFQCDRAEPGSMTPLSSQVAICAATASFAAVGQGYWCRKELSTKSGRCIVADGKAEHASAVTGMAVLTLICLATSSSMRAWSGTASWRDHGALVAWASRSNSAAMLAASCPALSSSKPVGRPEMEKPSAGKRSIPMIASATEVVTTSNVWWTVWPAQSRCSLMVPSRGI